MTLADFTAWLREGRYSCEAAQALLRSWESDLAATDNDSFEDFFHALLQEAASDPKQSNQFGSLTVHWLAGFMLSHCTLTFPLATDAHQDLASHIATELHAVRAYVSAWQGSCVLLQQPTQTVADCRRDCAQNLVHP